MISDTAIPSNIIPTVHENTGKDSRIDMIADHFNENTETILNIIQTNLKS